MIILKILDFSVFKYRLIYRYKGAENEKNCNNSNYVNYTCSYFCI